MKSFIKQFSGIGCFLGVVLYGVIAPACLAPAPEASPELVEVPPELEFAPAPNKCEPCHTTLDCHFFCGANTICLPKAGGDGDCVTAQAFTE